MVHRSRSLPDVHRRPGTPQYRHRPRPERECERDHRPRDQRSGFIGFEWQRPGPQTLCHDPQDEDGKEEQGRRHRARHRGTNRYPHPTTNERNAQPGVKTSPLNTTCYSFCYILAYSPILRGPEDPRTRGPEDPRTRGPEDPRTRGPEDPRTRGPEDPTSPPSSRTAPDSPLSSASPHGCDTARSGGRRK